MSEPTSIAQLEADITARRARLADTLNELSYRSQPKVIVGRQKQAARAKFSAATQDEYGDVRPFSQIMKAEERHIESLLRLFESCVLSARAWPGSTFPRSFWFSRC